MKKDIGHAFQLHVESCSGGSGPRRLKQSLAGTKRRRPHLERPDCRIISSPELAGNPVEAAGLKHRARRNSQSGSQLALLGIELALDHRHGGHWTNVMRKQDLKQSRADLREIVIDLQVNAGSEQGKAFE